MDFTKKIHICIYSSIQSNSGGSGPSILFINTVCIPFTLLPIFSQKFSLKLKASDSLKTFLIIAAWAHCFFCFFFNLCFQRRLLWGHSEAQVCHLGIFLHAPIFVRGSLQVSAFLHPVVYALALRAPLCLCWVSRCTGVPSICRKA